MKLVVLHLGFHKTGSSSIQESCFRNTEHLASYGYHYPVFRLGDRKIYNHSIPIYSLFCRAPENYHINKRWGVDVEVANNSYLSQLEELLLSKTKIIFSGEDICYLPEDRLTLLKEKILSHGFEIRVISFIRSPYSFLCSNIQQRIKTGSSNLARISAPNLSRIINRIKRVFPDSEFYPFERAKRNDRGLLGFFYDLIGLIEAPKVDVLNKKYNEGISNRSIRVLDFINSLHPIFKNDKLNPNNSVNVKLASYICFKGDRFLLTKAEFESIKHDIGKDNIDIGINLGEGFCDPTFLFSPRAIWDFESLVELVKIGQGLPVNLRKAVSLFISSLTNEDFNVESQCFVSLVSQPSKLIDLAISKEKKDLPLAYVATFVACNLEPKNQRNIAMFKKIEQKITGGKRFVRFRRLKLILLSKIKSILRK